MLESGSPRKQSRKKSVKRWEYHEVPNGSSVCGWLAGKVFWCLCHHVGHSKPCKRYLTKSELVCGFCEAGMEQVWRGYTPFYDRDYKRRFVLLPEDQEEQADEIRHLMQVRISRGKSMRDALVMRAENWRTTPLPESSERAFPIDIAPFLLQLWKDEELTSWCEKAERSRLIRHGDEPTSIPSFADDPAIKNLKNRIAKQKAGERLVADSLPTLNGVHLGKPGKKPD